MYDISLAGNYRRDVEGGFLIEGVTILAEGVWNGNLYSALELAKGATKWRDNTVWNRHYNDKSRDESNRIGVLKNQHFSFDSIIADVFLSNKTREGREMIDLVKSNKIGGISVEHVDTNINNKSTDIIFLGAAIVPDPGCTICNLSKGEAINMDEKDLETLKQTVAELAKSVETNDTKALHAKISDLEATVKAIPSIDLTPITDQAKKDAQTIKDLEQKVKDMGALESRLEKIEKQPVKSLQVDAELDNTYADIMITKDGITRRP